MKRKAIYIFILLICTVALFTACKEISPEEERLQNGFVVDVRFNANGGTFTPGELFAIETKVNSCIPYPGYGGAGAVGQIPIVTRTGYSIVGWYLGDVDEDGNVILTDTKWDFAKDKVTESLTLYARWQKNFTFRFNWNDADGEGFYEVAAVNGKLEAKNQNIDNLRNSVKRVGHSLLAVYSSEATGTDEDGNPIFDENDKITDFSTLTNPLDEDNPAFDVYSVWLKGDFFFVKEAADLKKAPPKNDLYFESPTDILDFEGDGWKIGEYFTGKIIGNNHTVKNLKMTYKNEKERRYFGLFGRLTGAEISDITFEDCTVEVIYESGSVSYHKTIGFFAGEVKGNTILKNIILTKDSRLNVSISPTVTSGSWTPPVAPYYYGNNEGTGTLNITGNVEYN